MSAVSGEVVDEYQEGEGYFVKEGQLYVARIWNGREWTEQVAVYAADAWASAAMLASDTGP